MVWVVRSIGGFDVFEYLCELFVLVLEFEISEGFYEDFQ